MGPARLLLEWRRHGAGEAASRRGGRPRRGAVPRVPADRAGRDRRDHEAAETRGDPPRTSREPLREDRRAATLQLGAAPHPLQLRDRSKVHGEGCGRRLGWDDFTADHVRPFSRGGRTVLSNAALLCRKHNSAKGNRRSERRR
ncbi:MAG: HNH endonuclease [Holophagales bacterium]|nr:HNH endonuclease [Holophagales bacterium]